MYLASNVFGHHPAGAGLSDILNNLDNEKAKSRMLNLWHEYRVGLTELKKLDLYAIFFFAMLAWRDDFLEKKVPEEAKSHYRNIIIGEARDLLRSHGRTLDHTRLSQASVDLTEKT